MTKSELKEIIRETILTEMVNIPPEHRKINSKLMQIAQRGVNDVKDDEEEEDEVSGWSYERNPNDPEDYPSLKTRVYHNKKTGKYYLGKIGDGENDWNTKVSEYKP